MSEEVYKILEQYERHLLTAKEAKYITGLGSKSAREIIGAYNALYGAHKSFTTCSRCLEKMCEKLALDFFAEKERRNA